MFRDSYSTILCRVEGPVVRVVLNRPEVHNAFNGDMLAELLDVFSVLHSAARESTDVRVVVFTGEGKSFCAGADLNWMKRVKDFTFEENLKESLQISELFYSIYSLPLPTVARVNGAAVGGGMGFVASCDMAVASSEARFSLSEVKLGLVPACISPYVIRKAGEGACREFMLTGERLTAEKAMRLGLVNETVEPSGLDAAVSSLVERLISSGPRAIGMCKELLRTVPGMSLDEVKTATAEAIARLRVSEEGQEGMKAFLEKRKPRWSSGA
ncbi:MAG: enoyl-CoA hydratase/isomerase family protein [Candidatus Eisenbacteria bacterium]|nr:enoyl-CoA hydratase/isomerase family protein [Candidatus Eisenbacteria bacterium]